ncbi:MAG: radical SAM protein [Desulfobacterales bacterium]
MNFVVGDLIEPVFRPPSEWNALLLGVTNGCTHRCTYCSMYIDKKFSVRKDMDQIRKEIDLAHKLYGNRVQKVFFEDGNAFTVDAEMLIEITEYCSKALPNLRKVSAYAHAKDILKKSDEELKQLARAGFTMVYVGIESGDDEVLKAVRKGTNQDEFTQAAQKCHQAGIAWSGIFLLGLAGSDPEKSKKHAIESAELINRMAPPEPVEWYISPLTLGISPGTELWKQQQRGEFQTGSFIQILEELQTMVEYTDDTLQNCVFNSNHASNYLSLQGTLGENKVQFLEAIGKAIEYANLHQLQARN